MHLFKNSVSFIAVMCVFGAVYGAQTSRVGISMNGAMRRLPSLSGATKVMTVSSATTASSNSTSTSSSSTTGTSLLDDTDCIDAYRDCMKSDNACGSNFEECTTNVLFHGHMGECFSTLYQCSPEAIEQLMGTSDLNALSDVDSYVADTKDTEVARYTYPTDGSVMGIDIIGASTRNKLSTADCVKKYKRCLTKDNVCGEDFELCTSADEFKKQAVMCDSTLARCQKEGFQQIFGDDVTTKPTNKKLKPNTDGDAHKWIEDGATLAAANAVNTCYKVVDNCFANACAKNPYSCVEDVDWSVVNSAQSIVEAGININDIDTTRTGKQMASDVRKFFRSACTDTIGANQYCFMTFNDGKKPTKSDLQDEDLREDIFGEAYASRKTILTNKVNELVKSFDTSARNKCIETFKTCAVYSCGGGSGAACYNRVFGGNNPSNTINSSAVYNDIKAGCTAVVNADANCRYMAAIQDGGYTYELGVVPDSFNSLFPPADAGNANSNLPIVAALNADLSLAYNAGAIEQMKRQCSNVVTNCVKSLCGKDFKNCYRNRNDVSIAAYSTGAESFDASMNRMGGVLDYTIVQGLCASTVKSADACTESLAIAKVGLSDGGADVSGTWGSGINTNSTISSVWRNSAKGVQATADRVQETNDMGRKICECTGGGTGICGYEEGGNNDCQVAHMVTKSYLLDTLATASLFQEVLADVEREAQAVYKAKLNKEQNICLAQNTGASPNPTFVWAKLKGKINTDYASQGLGEGASVESNDLYGSFCRVKVTLQSEDKDMQTLLNGGSIKIGVKDGVGIFNVGKPSEAKAEAKELYADNEANAYFAVGDTFKCGSWISQNTIDAITEKVNYDAQVAAGRGSQSDYNTLLWTTLGLGTVGTIGSYIGMDALQSSGSSLGGLLNTKKVPSAAEKTQAETCMTEAKKAQDILVDISDDTTLDKNKVSKLVNTTNSARKAAKNAKASTTGISFVQPTETGTDADVLNAWKNAYTNYNNDLTRLYNACEKVKSNEGTEKSHLGANLIAAGVGGVATTLLANGIVASAQAAKYENAGNEAVKKWMDNIGSKIHCYVGGQKVADFGEIISIDITED